MPFSGFTSSAHLLHWLTLIIVFLAGRLAIELHFKHTMPVFQGYLIALVAALLLLDGSGNPYIELAVLALKWAATAEVLGMLCAEADDDEICWICLFSAGAAGVMCCLVVDFNRQPNLEFVDMRYVKHICQVILLLITVSVTLFAVIAYELRGWQVKHALIMCCLWLSYAVAGVMAPGTMHNWILVRSVWCVAAIACLGAWHWALRYSVEYEHSLLPDHPHALSDDEI